MRPWFKNTALAVAALALLAGFAVLAYQMALARVPQHRAALEHLVRAHTGLDVRFNELTLRWGWYGPEAVFRRVELGEPGREGVLLSAPQLIVGFDAWRTVQTGHLAAGRIKLVSPDINFARAAAAPSESRADPAARNKQRATARAPQGPGAAEVLQRWSGGRIDIEGGTLQLTDPGGSAHALSLQIRSLTLRRADDVWSAQGYLFLPERLGRFARISAKLNGNLLDARQLDGSVQFEGRYLVLGGWRDVLAQRSAAFAHLPHAGHGDVLFKAVFKDGRVSEAQGEVTASDVWLPARAEKVLAVDVDHDANRDAVTPLQDLTLNSLRGQWQATRRALGWHIEVEQFAWEAGEQKLPATRLQLDMGHAASYLRGELQAAALNCLWPVLQWLAPGFSLEGVLAIDGTAREIEFDWDAGRPAGQRLRASAALEDLRFAQPARGFELTGTAAHVTASEDTVTADVQAAEATLTLAHLPDEALHPLRIGSRVQLARRETGWELSTEDLTLEHERGVLKLAGSLQPVRARAPEPQIEAARGAEASAASEETTPAQPVALPDVRLRGTLERMDIAFLKQLLGEHAAVVLGSAAERLAAGHIDSARFELAGPLNQLLIAPGARLARLSIGLRDAALSVAPDWPDIESLRGTLNFEARRLQRSTLTGSWFNGPVTLRLSERGTGGWQVRAQGQLNAQSLARALNLEEAHQLSGRTIWSGEFTYRPANGTRQASWRAHADASLVGVVSELAAPLNKSASVAAPTHVEFIGNAEHATVRYAIVGRKQDTLQLEGLPQGGWRLARESES